MEKISVISNAIFVLIALITVWQFYKASNHSKIFLTIAGIIGITQLGIGLTDFYEDQSTIPPRFVLLFLPALILTILTFVTKKGKEFIDNLNIKNLTILHTIRIPVEITLHYLFLVKAIPQIMTYEGWNFDIIAGLSAPLVYYFGFVKNQLSKGILITWNIISLGLLMNIVTIAILSQKTPFQQLAIGEPNFAIGHFPYNWLPSIIVPIVLFSHLAALRLLILGKRNTVE
jgi:hypothetical protein